MSDGAVLAIFLIITLAAVPVVRSRAYGTLIAAFDAVAARPAVAMLICGLAAFCGSMLVSVLVMWPEPRVHDEFSYLLAADTFAHGRLTNPTHPLWQHFESFHIFHQPTYASKYPPAQGLVLALGILLGGEPAVGLWLSAALMSATICWMLSAFVSPRWALLGALIATAQIGVATYWTQTFWGGAVAAAGGALVFGAAARSGNQARVRDGLLLGLGLVVLANSRPFEGAIASLAAMAYLAYAFFRDPGPHKATVAAAALVLAIGGAAMATYNHAVVGSWWLPPYLHHEQLYAVKPSVIFQERRAAPVFHHEVMRQYYDYSEAGGDDHSDPTRESTPEVLEPGTLRKLWTFLAGRVLVVPLCIGVLYAFTSARGAMLVASVGLTIVSLALNFYFRIHYAAPMTAAVFALIAIGLERIEALRWRSVPVGRALCMAVVVSMIGSLALEVTHVPDIHIVGGEDDFYYRRLRAIETLGESDGQDLVVVEYGPQHDVHREWVYNAADIDAADIVWARSMGADRDRELLDYFPHRRVWRLRDGFGPDADGLERY